MRQIIEKGIGRCGPTNVTRLLVNFFSLNFNRIDETLKEETAKTMEEESVAVNENGEVSPKQRVTTQVFLQLGRPVSPKEKPLYIDSNSNLQHEEVSIQVNGAKTNEGSDDKGNEVKEPISEAEFVVVEKTPVVHRNPDDESKEDDSTTVENLLVNIESVINDISPQRTQQSSDDKGEAPEDAPVVIEKRPPSLHIEHVIDQHEHDEKTDGDEREPIAETEVVVVEKTPTAFDSDILVENESHEKDARKDDSTTVQSLLVNIETAIDHPSSDTSEEPADDSKAEALEEDAPVVIEKRPSSLHMEPVLDQDESDENKDREERELVAEAELVMVEKTPATLESELLVEIESREDEAKDDNATVESLLTNIETAIHHPSPDRTKKPADESKAEALEEDSPMVIEKRPVSFHVEHALAQVERGEKADLDEREPVAEAEFVVVQKTPAALESEILVEKETHENESQEDNTTVESLLINIESSVDHPSPDHTGKPADEGKAEALEEDAPVVIEKRPVSLHMEHALAQDERGEETDGIEREPVAEAELVVVEKTPATLESELLVEKESPKDEAQDDNATVESLLTNIESVIDHPLPDRTEKPADEGKPDALEEDAPVVIEKRPVSLHIEHAMDHDEHGEKTDGDEREPIAEAEVVAVEKTPAALESGILVEHESHEKEPMEDDSATVESLLINIESSIDHPSPGRTEEPEDESKAEALEEDTPVVIEKRPVSLHMESVLDRDEGDENKAGDEREPIAEAELVVVQKTPAALESEILVEKETHENESQEDNTTVESLLINIESSVDHPSPDHTEKPADEGKAEALEEDAPVVIEKRPVSLHMEHALAQDERGEEADGIEREPVAEAELVVVEKTPATLESELLVEKESPKDEAQDDNATVESLLTNIESVIDHPLPDRTEKPADEGKPDALEEDAPVVIEKRPVSLHIEHAMDHDEHGEKTDGDEREPIAEAEVVAVEKTPAALESGILVEHESHEKEPMEDDSATVESLLINIESSIDHPSPGRTEEPEDESKAEALEEDTPVVIEKRPVSLHMESVLDRDEGDENKAGDEREPIAEAELVVVQKTPAALESEILVEKETHENEPQGDNATVESLLINIESAIDHPLPDRTDKPADGSEAEALEEDAPVVIEKRPVSLHMENVLDQDAGDETKAGDEREPVAEAELVVVEKTPVALESEILVENEEEANESTTVESLLVNIESVMDDTPPESIEEPSENKAEALEDAPVVTEKRPVSLHMKHATDHDENEGQKVADENEAQENELIQEAEVVVVEKTPAALESEILVEKECPEDESKEDDNATVDSLLVKIESVIDHPSPEKSQEPVDQNNADVLEEDAPVVIEKKPASVHIKQVLDQDERNADENQLDVVETVGKVDGEQAPEYLEPIAEAELVVVEKTPARLESEMLIEQESPADDDATVESLLVNIESVIDDTSPDETESKEIESRQPDAKEPIEEGAPIVVEKRRVSLNVEPLLDLDTTEEKPEDKEDEPKHTEVVTTTFTFTTNQTTRKIETSPQEEVGAPASVVKQTTTTEETLTSTSYTKLVHKDGLGDDTELLRYVLRKRLSAPEVLPEKEKDGSAPLAPSESGILDSKEHFTIEDTSRAKTPTPKNTAAKPEAAPLEAEPYKDVQEKEKLIVDVPGEVKVDEKAEGGREPSAVAEDEKGLLDAEDGEKADEKKERKKGRKGLHSPQCKCCSVM